MFNKKGEKDNFNGSRANTNLSLYLPKASMLKKILNKKLLISLFI